MKITKKIDSVGRIAIPRDIRRSLRWMDGDEIEIISNAIPLRRSYPRSRNSWYTLR